ncbi:homoserine O-succinyltransferase-domain-containing protein, partial [Baffinella frigidus]
ELRFSEIKGEKYDGVIVTGAPIEHLPFDQVKYWGELCEFLDDVKAMDAGMLSLCWGAMATLYHFHAVPKHIVITLSLAMSDRNVDEL